MQNLVKFAAVGALMMCGGAAWAAQGYIGEGVQGRPHAHDAVIKNYYYRHGMGYTMHPSRAKTRRFWAHRRYMVLHKHY